MNGLVVIAHAPLASALRACVAHVFPDRLDGVVAVDVQPQASADESLAQAAHAAAALGAGPLLILTDVLGATPANVARRLLAQRGGRLVAGANVPMMLRAVTYQDEPLDALASRALEGGRLGVLEIHEA
jgi:PTS system ascorbate-specific IIA component